MQYEPMISAMLRKLNIRREHDNFRQAARLALCHAYAKYDRDRGHFAPFAFRTIRGAMLDELKKESRQIAFGTPLSTEVLETLHGRQDQEDALTPDNRIPMLHEALARLTEEDRLLLTRLFAERMPYAECARLAGITVPGIKKRRERILAKLRKQITVMMDDNTEVV